MVEFFSWACSLSVHDDYTTKDIIMTEVSTSGLPVPYGSCVGYIIPFTHFNYIQYCYSKNVYF